MKNQKTLNALRKKAGLGICESSRMPNLNKVGELLTELGIENNVTTWSCTKWTSAAGYRYYTSGGTREYNGYRLKVPQINMNIDSTETYYSWNTERYAADLIRIINSNLKTTNNESTIPILVHRWPRLLCEQNERVQ